MHVIVCHCVTVSHSRFHSATKVEDLPKNFGLLQQMQAMQTAPSDASQPSCGCIMMAESMLREVYERLLATTGESHEFQLQLAQTQVQHAQTQEQLGQTQLELLETRGRLLQASALTDEILAENESLQFKCQITEQEVCNLRQFKHSITAVTSGHAFWQSSWGS